MALVTVLLQNAVIIVTLLIFAAICYALLRSLYNVTLHPLSSYPGPLSTRLSVIPRLYHLQAGDNPHWVASLHDVYGPVVRIAPHELSFVDPMAWRDIYGRKPGDGKQRELSMDPIFYGQPPADGGPGNLMSSNKEQHDLMRRALAPAFAPTALRAHEGVIGGYADLLIQRLREATGGGLGKGATKDVTQAAKPVDITAYLNFFTFDVLGVLAFSSDFGCLRTSDYHPWIRLIMSSLKNMATMQVLCHLGLLQGVAWAAKKFKVGLEAQRIHRELTVSKVKQRLEMDEQMKKEGRADFLGGLIEHGFGHTTLEANAGLLVIAGSETTATLLSGAVYLLATHADALGKLQSEVRARFSNESEITLSSVNSLTYMLACLNEALRMYPPVAITGPRVTPEGGAVIAGHAVPEGATVGVWHLAMYRSAALFADPYGFHPERFEGKDARFSNDKLDAVQPFSLGPRDCLGRNLAYMEMRLVLAKLVWNFNIRLSGDSSDWLERNKVHLLWDKPPLNVYLDPVAR
ncbi:uncharacterized protein JN550_009051 [Neoarthrinium moseri]|uniref:uncharacterized protein n=1 Tax=Neoarthrinium moseri TaxID=1658444 RepID=UPI001FDE8C83|nr:uncharacterized protein JN550_009051 [Neoarthrinium moseri]KAI1864031.1 hypothetical protein JN550_009051 [Neoarthrinium moseri]